VRLLLVNAFHYMRGGVERAYFDEARWLGEAGHEILHFATQDPRNRDSPTSRYFAPAADFGEHAPLASQLSRIHHLVWSRPAADAMDRLLRDHRPDVAHVHAPSRYLTPSVLRSLERAGVPIVMTLHDFKPWCTNRTMFAKGAACERCKGGRHYQAAVVGCVQHSRLKSVAAAIEAYAHAASGAYRGVRLWIAPSRFVRDKVVEHGLDPDRIRVLPHALETVRVRANASGPAAAADLPDRPFALFAGRLSEEKGVRWLPAVALRLAPTPLVVAGDGPLRAWLAAQSASVPNLRCVGHLDEAALAESMRAAGVALIPSLFYETYCYAAAEAMAAALPVVASRIGAIPELVEDQVTGLLASPGDPHAMAEGARRALEDPGARGWGSAGRARIERLADPTRHLQGLLDTYREAIAAPSAESRTPMA
jgi:glycosyltransferase involved in cell wall biosynthesis